MICQPGVCTGKIMITGSGCLTPQRPRLLNHNPRSYWLGSRMALLLHLRTKFSEADWSSSGDKIMAWDVSSIRGKTDPRSLLI